MKPSKKCSKCRYWSQPYKTGIGTCDYLFITGNRRPCEPGDDCTAMEPKRRSRRNTSRKEGDAQ